MLFNTMYMSFWKFIGRLALLDFFFGTISRRKTSECKSATWNNPPSLGLENDGIDEHDFYSYLPHYTSDNLIEDSTSDFDYDDDCDDW